MRVGIWQYMCRESMLETRVMKSVNTLEVSGLQQ